MSSLIVSLVIPSLNRAHLLRPTIESVLGQDYPLIECIVVDGGSTDGTLALLKTYGDRIRWVSEPDQGHADAINKGWRMSRGEVLAWLNADDIWEAPSAVRQVVAFLEERPHVDVVYGDCGNIDADGTLEGMSYVRDWDLAYAVKFHDHCIPQPAAFIRRAILEKVGFLDTRFYAMDKELWWRIGLHGAIQRIPCLLAHARSTSGKSHDGPQMAEDCVRLARHFFALDQVPPELMQEKRRALSNAYLRGVDYAYLFGPHWLLMCKYTLAALIVDPSNVPFLARRLGRFLFRRRGQGRTPAGGTRLADKPAASLREKADRPASHSNMQ
ncbi:MAG: glycosyltransferase [Deltaproteobacteria bacterium]|nr:glycosyltransferase [Deltaproteobacteria bacterium]